MLLLVTNTTNIRRRRFSTFLFCFELSIISSKQRKIEKKKTQQQQIHIELSTNMALTSQEMSSATETINTTQPKCSTDEPSAKRAKTTAEPPTISHNDEISQTFSHVESADAHDQHTPCDNNGGRTEQSVGDECVNGLTDLPKNGEVVNRHIPRRIGPYVLGPKLNYSPIDSIAMHLARHVETDEYVQLKVSELLALCLWYSRYNGLCWTFFSF